MIHFSSLSLPLTALILYRSDESYVCMCSVRGTVCTVYRQCIDMRWGEKDVAVDVYVYVYEYVYEICNMYI